MRAEQERNENLLKLYFMKYTSSAIFICLFIALSGCQLAGDIFKAGVLWGILLVVAVVGLIIFLIGKASQK